MSYDMTKRARGTMTTERTDHKEPTMNTPDLAETLTNLTADERTEAAATFRRVLAELPPADDPTDAGLRHSMRVAIDVLEG